MPCVNFCNSILLTFIFSLDKKLTDCNITLIPPKPISPLAIIVFIIILTLQEDKSKQPLVISIMPAKQASTVELLKFLNIWQIQEDKKFNTPKFFNKSIKRKLNTI